MSLSRWTAYAVLASASMIGATAAQADTFVNGGFDNGTASGWTQGGASRAGTSNPSLVAANFIPGDGGTRSSVIAAGTVDATVGALLGTTVYAGTHSFRVEDTTFGGNASVIQQRVNNYSDANIFFAWKSVLEGAHTTTNSATMIITLTDLTTSTELIRREYNAGSGGGGVDPRFAFDGTYYYTPQWQIEQLAIGAGLAGHDFLLSVLGADCQPTGHLGYVYLDGFGAVTPPPGVVPEPATWAMMIAGFGMAGAAVRRRQRKVALA